MSKKTGGTSFATKSMFDVLAQNGAEEEEEEEVEEEETPQTEGNASNEENKTNGTLSKSARKRLARQNAKAKTTPTSNGSSSAAASQTQETVKQEEVAQNLSHASSAKVNGDHSTTTVKQEKEVSSWDSASAPAPKGDHHPSTSNGDSAASDPTTLVGSTSSPTGAKKESAPCAENTPTVPSKSAFKPQLPDSLPSPSSLALPSNRKRRTPEDFTPSGPRDVSTAASPSKSNVKFEDGVGPGEGKDGEKIIASPKKDRNVIERTVWTFIMIGGFIRHPYVILLVLVCQALVYKEVTALFELRDQGTKSTASEDSWSKTLNWYFFVVTNYFLYGESIIYYFKHIVFVDAYFIPFARNHRFISFMLYVVGFVGFVANLQRQYLRRQFALFCWVHITLFLIVVSSHFIVNNILEGMIWFFVPASLVICNDVMAYICGKAFGKTPLIKLSPKKTMEGFIGAFLCTLVFGLAWSTFFMRFPYMICPARDLGTNIFSHVTCRLNPVFVWRDFEFTGPVRSILQSILGRPPPSIPYAPFQIHSLFMATFASLVAPFGGFFASGFKRAFNVKDFGHSIPGHGGMTDRMDCQFMMGMFSYVYYSSLVRVQYIDVGSVMQTIVTSLSVSEQLEVLADLRKYLQGQGVKI